MNHLQSEASPYLLQHAGNPVDWYPWCAEAFDRAKQEQKPIFLSIGYSTCHWCHVMAKECFEDPQVADVLNQHFISIKVDKEERPDIDGVYMAVCQAMTGSGGWPTSIFMTPDQAPFFAGTYFPRAVGAVWRGLFGPAGGGRPAVAGKPRRAGAGGTIAHSPSGRGGAAQPRPGPGRPDFPGTGPDVCRRRRAGQTPGHPGPFHQGAASASP